MSNSDHDSKSTVGEATWNTYFSINRMMWTSLMPSSLNNAGKNTGNNADSSKTEKKHKLKKQDEDGRFSLPGREDLEKFFYDNVIDIIQRQDEYKKMGIDFPSAIILEGPPGCGKTFAVDKLISYLGWPKYSIDSGSIGSPYIHETSKKVSEVFHKAISTAPSVIVIDEMESFLSARSGAGPEKHHVEEVDEFLRLIPEATKNHVLVIAMTNLIDDIDPAIRRTGRFDYTIKVGMPSVKEIQAVLKNGLLKYPHEEEMDLSEISEALLGHPLSDIAFLLRGAAIATVRTHQEKITLETIKSVMISKEWI